jgi:cyclomaltodextrinase
MEKTSIILRNKLLYQVFVRNHTPEGTFRALIGDLDRIRALGTDIVYLLPIHPIGKKNRKGSIGSPYSIFDYREINSDLGTKEDFQALIEAIHGRKMKLMIDVVYNHTSRDSRLLKTHPEWFYKNENGVFANRVGEWWDVTDFDFHADKALWTELADTLKSYAEMGVDGFRCDVASLVPLKFWAYARKIVSQANKQVIWLSESVHGGFIKYIRDSGFGAASEAEIFQVFDMAYDYDTQPYFEGYLKGKRPLRDYLESVARQEEIYPANYVKMKNLENHDIDRIAGMVHGDKEKILNWTALAFLQKGAVMLYAGEEFCAEKRPDLFEKDVFERKDDISAFIAQLAHIKKRPVFADGIWKINIPEVDGVACNTVENQKEKWIGIFNVGLADGEIPVDLPDGKHINRLTGKAIWITQGKMPLVHDPVLLKITK